MADLDSFFAKKDKKKKKGKEKKFPKTTSTSMVKSLEVSILIFYYSFTKMADIISLSLTRQQKPLQRSKRRR